MSSSNLFRCALLVCCLLVTSSARAAIKLGEEDAQIAVRTAELLQAGDSAGLMSYLTQAHVTPPRLETILSAFFLVTADLRLEEAEKQVGRSQIAAVEGRATERPRRANVRDVSAEQLRTSLDQSRQDVRRNLSQYFEPDSEAHLQARRLVTTHRAGMDLLFDILQGERGEQ
ncbi:MAG TPA: hypothetical protein VIF83_00015 [Gemmatimonadaceae bacterium]|jgi:hypothetical protein